MADLTLLCAASFFALTTICLLFERLYLRRERITRHRKYVDEHKARMTAWMKRAKPYYYMLICARYIKNSQRTSYYSDYLNSYNVRDLPFEQDLHDQSMELTR